ncbi:hypothetical protein QJS04_geneDACA011052 [Acorus gramineus]|uniref:Uncharacterized protein n=1 Tax=Acorus gramineus TaxID=55184 RepID=A0AAV9BEX0_ACOGR|nr:hypothetical protein QJS04_geneDACA011052 [Acorus gramineus]
MHPLHSLLSFLDDGVLHQTLQRSIASSLDVLVSQLLSSSPGSMPPPQTSSSPGEAQSSFFKPAPPTNVTAEGKAALHPRRTPVTDKEIETVMVIFYILCEDVGQACIN